MKNHPSTFDPEITAYAKEILEKLNIRYSTKRVKLLALIYGNGLCHHHFSVDMLMEKTKGYGISVFLATLYNTIRIFVQKRFLNEIMLPLGQRMFDTNVTDHQHYYNLHTRELYDIPFDFPSKKCLPPLMALSSMASN